MGLRALNADSRSTYERFTDIYEYLRRRSSSLAIFRGYNLQLRIVTSAGRKHRVGEYQLNLFAAKDGGFAFDVQPVNASGTSPYVNFECWHEFHEFLSSLNLSKDLIAQIEGLCVTLKPGNAFHQRMFLPPCVEEGLKALHGEANTQLLCA